MSIDIQPEKNVKSEENDCSDLDSCVKNILTWEKHIPTTENSMKSKKSIETQSNQLKLIQDHLINFNSKTRELNEQNKLLKGQLEMVKANQSLDRNTISDLQETVKSLQEILKNRLDKEEELEVVRNDLILQKDKVAQTESKLLSEKEKFSENHRIQESKHATELEKLKNELAEQYLQKEKELKKNIENLNLTVKVECEKMKKMERKHESQIVKMQMEYEGKLALVQAQNSRLQSSSNNVIFGGNEVFRKKLEHIQEELTSEIKRLKQEITVLKLKLETNTQVKKNLTSPIAGRPGILKRRRF